MTHPPSNTATVERYEEFAPIEALRSRFSHGYLREEEDHVAVILFVERGAGKVEVHFTRVPAYRRVMEECSLGALDGLWERPEENISSFVVRNSRWVASFSEAELLHYQNPVHYVFLTGWQQLEVLTTEQPIVIASDA
jgi:hypothetical protein